MIYLAIFELCSSTVSEGECIVGVRRVGRDQAAPAGVDGGGAALASGPRLGRLPSHAALRSVPLQVRAPGRAGRRAHRRHPHGALRRAQPGRGVRHPRRTVTPSGATFFFKIFFQIKKKINVFFFRRFVC